MSRLPACVAPLFIATALLTAQRPLTAQTPRDRSPVGLLAIQQVTEGTIPVAIVVTSSSAASTGPLPLVHSDYGEKISPALQWTGVPAAARSLAVVMEDPDAQEPKPFVHWLLYNLPASVTSLPEALPGLPRLPELEGALQGRNSKGTIGYYGPRPRKTDPAHRYHFQIFAVSEMLSLYPSASREALLGALGGRVIAAGELVVTFQAPLDAR
jgi:Raf kinase inhibitor-like YbhB/YbcL family protein